MFDEFDVGVGRSLIALWIARCCENRFVCDKNQHHTPASRGQVVGAAFDEVVTVLCKAGAKVEEFNCLRAGGCGGGRGTP